MEKIVYRGWPNCYRAANGTAELVVTADVGPRVIRFGFAGSENEFYENPEELGKTGGETWRMYGGHRLWHAPEDPLRTYVPDNAPVQVEEHPGFTRFLQPAEAGTGIGKELDIRLDPREARAEVVHRLRNRNPWAVELAPWALSVLAPGGTAVIPLPPRGTHPKDLLPASTLTLWAYTDMSDPRWTWGERYVLLRQDAWAKRPQKFGALVPGGWAAYANQGHLFLKQFPVDPAARYADFGCNVEAFTNKAMLEVETLGPLAKVQPGGYVEHLERWALFRDVPLPSGDSDVERHVLPKVQG